MNHTRSIRRLLLSALFLAPIASPAAEPVAPASKAAQSASGDSTLTPKALTKGTVLKIKASINTTGKWTYTKFDQQNIDNFSEFHLAEETLSWITPTLYGDPDGDQFSCVYKKIDNFTAQITFKQTKAGGGDTLKNEYGTGKFILLFTSYDKSTSTLHGTMVMSDNYRGYGTYDKENVGGNYVDSSNGSGIFSLKIK